MRPRLVLLDRGRKILANPSVLPTAQSLIPPGCPPKDNHSGRQALVDSDRWEGSFLLGDESECGYFRVGAIRCILWPQWFP